MKTREPVCVSRAPEKSVQGPTIGRSADPLSIVACDVETTSRLRTKPMDDVQNSHDDRGIAIDRVGITAIKYPLTIMDRAKKTQHTIANVTLSANLPHHQKGTHMSRFVEVLNRHHEQITMQSCP